MQVLHQTLATTDRPATVLAWLSSATSQAMLTELAAGLRPLTHAALDKMPASKPLAHLRSVLVATGTLPARDEYLVQLERWITQTVAGRADPQEKEILHRYAAWHVLRRLRHRIRGTRATHGQRRRRPPEHRCRRDIPELADRTRSHTGLLPAGRP